MVFVPYTSHSNLANGLRTNEEKLDGMAGYRMKVVEKGGIKLVDLLHKANPWAGQDCGRDRCMLCTTKKKEGKKFSQDCVYKTYCMTCTQRKDMEIEERYKDIGKKKIEEEQRKARRYIHVG